MDCENIIISEKESINMSAPNVNNIQRANETQKSQTNRRCEHIEISLIFIGNMISNRIACNAIRHDENMIFHSFYFVVVAQKKVDARRAKEKRFIHQTKIEWLSRVCVP